MSARWKTVIWSCIGAVLSSGALGLAVQLWSAPAVNAVLEQRVHAQEEKAKELSGVPVTLERIETKLEDVISRLSRVEAKQDAAPEPAHRKGR